MPGLREQWLKDNNLRDRTIIGEMQERRETLEKLGRRSPQEKKIARANMAKKLLTAIKKYYDSYYQVGTQIGKKITSLVPTKIDDAISNFAGEASRVRDDLYNQLFDYLIKQVNNELQLERKDKNENKSKTNEKTQQQESTLQEEGEDDP